MKKRVWPLVLCFVLCAACLMGCSGGASPGAAAEKNVEGALEDLIQMIYDGTDDTVELPRGLMNIPLSEDMGSAGGAGIDYYIGVKGIPFTEGVASESLIGAAAYSMVLLRMEEGADIADAEQQIRDSVKPNKWICVSVDPSDVVVDHLGNLVILIMSEHAQALHESFLKLAD